jgi:hypothetical protein
MDQMGESGMKKIGKVGIVHRVDWVEPPDVQP